MLLLFSSRPPTKVEWWDRTEEQSLIQSIMTEAITFHSITATYMPRELRREDVLYNEDILSNFTRTFRIKVYLKNVQGWDGQHDFLSKFGIQVKDSVSIMLSKETFVDVFGDSEIVRPREGDLVYLPSPLDALFEVKFVEHETSQGQFYPLGISTFYDLKLETYTNNQENFATGNTSLDVFESDRAYAQTLTFDAGGSGTYTVGETVYQGSNLSIATASGIVGSWNANTYVLKLTSLTGTFANAISVTGATSNAIFTLAGTPDLLALPNDAVADNEYLRDQGLDILASDSD